MRLFRLLTVLLIALGAAAPATAGGVIPLLNRRLPRNLHGTLLDFTHNHGPDNRIYSAALCEKRDLYVYLPPGFCPDRQYPGMLYLHGFTQDEDGFLDLVGRFDCAMARGDLPPMIVVAPDGSIEGRSTLRSGGSFYINSKAGDFEDYIIQDVWGWARATFPIRPDRDAHVLSGASMGGCGAYNLGIKYPDEFKLIAGIMPPLNLRYSDCHGRFLGPFHPECFGYQPRLKPLMPVARFYGVLVIHQRRLARPLLERGQAGIEAMARQNPTEMLDAYDVKPGPQCWFIAYGKKDEFNVAGQVESFLSVARPRGLDPVVVCDPDGHHNLKSGLKLLPPFVAWLAERLPKE